MQIINEEVQLSKGSKSVLQNRKLVSEIADELKDECRLNPGAFPAGTKLRFNQMSDEEIARWFLLQIDEIEQAGYDGIKFSQNGSNNMWLAQRFVSGGHTWEDITHKLALQMDQWARLKKYNLLEPRHLNIPAFTGLQQLGRVISMHYADKLKSIQDEVALEKIRKNARSLKLVDNEDYTIYTTLNRAANQLVGNNTTWCTTSRNPGDTRFDLYANQAMLFQLFPKNAKEVSIQKYGRSDPITGKERYQFGADSGYSFMDIADVPVSNEVIQSRFPYLYSDLVTALRELKPEINRLTKEWKEDPVFKKYPELQIKEYNIDAEIKKLQGFIARGKFTDNVRPKAVEGPEQASAPPETPPTQQNESSLFDDHTNFIIKEGKMSNVDKDVAAMLASLKKYDLQAKKQILRESAMERYSEEGLGEADSNTKGHRFTMVGMKYPSAEERARGITPKPVILARFENMVDAENAFPRYKEYHDFDEYHLIQKDTGHRWFMDDGHNDDGEIFTPIRKEDWHYPYYFDPEAKTDFDGLDEADMEEGNRFSGARQNAINQGRSTFSVGGEEFPVKENMDEESLDEMFDYLGLDTTSDRPTHDELARRAALADFENSRGRSLMGTYGDEYKDRFRYGDMYNIAGPKGPLPEDESGAAVDEENLLDMSKQPDQEVMEWMSRFNRLGKI